jgi:hypothetical protein
LLDSNKGEWTKGIAHWREGDIAYLSVAFTWRLPQARALAESYRSVGCHVIAGGPGTFPKKIRDEWLGDVAEVPDPMNPKNWLHDTTVRHNPMSTRASYGCPVGCWFCIVPKMFGKTFTLLPDFPVRPVLCDDNLSDLPVEYQKHIVSRYVSSETWLLDANSGFEPAAFTGETRAIWQPILKGPWRFGYDEKTEGEAVERAFRVLRDVSPRRKQVYTMIGHEPFDVCMDRIRRVIEWGGEPYAQPFIKLNAIVKEPDIRHDWTAQKLRHVHRWVNRHLWRKTRFEDYDASVKTNHPRKVRGFDLKNQKAACVISENVVSIYRNNMHPYRRGDLAEITMKINVGNDVNMDQLRYWIEAGVALDDNGIDVHGYSAELRAEEPEVQGADQPAAPVRTGRRGRTPNAVKVAERLAAEQAAQQPSAAQQPAAQQPPPPPTGAPLPPGSPLPPAGPLPPGVGAQASAPPPPMTLVSSGAPTPPATVTETALSTIAAAMPHAAPADPLNGNGVMSLEDFRGAIKSIMTTKPAAPMKMFRSTVWPDGTPKAAVFTIEAVPETDREIYINNLAVA